jgi:ornithine cyclodeaminase
MNYYDNHQVAQHLDMASASEAIRTAYLEMQAGAAAVQIRSRIALPAAKFSTMAAMLWSARIAAVKMYTTLDGQFRFYIALFSLDDGALLAMLEGDSITRFRTAATTALAAHYLARPSSRTLGVFGSGVQASAHAEALAQRFEFREASIRSHDAATAQALAERLQTQYGIAATLADAPQTASADVVVLATRASEPLIRGEWLSPGAFVASIGATRPDQRELDDASLERAGQIVVDWSVQTPLETGDLVLPPRDLLARKPLTDLADIIAADTRRSSDLSDPSDAHDIVLYKAVGIGLQDAAIAHLAYTRLRASGAGTRTGAS